MKKFAIILIAVGGIIFAYNLFSKFTKQSENPTAPTTMLLMSPSFKNNELIPLKFSCDGGDISPELHIQNVPDEAKSLALVMDDPDATGGTTFTHWLLWNIDPKIRIIKEGSRPAGSVEGTNSTGRIGYMGPCPPRGSTPHRYFFKLYALNNMLDLQEGSDKSALESEIKKCLLEKTELVGLFGR